MTLETLLMGLIDLRVALCRGLLAANLGPSTVPTHVIGLTCLEARGTEEGKTLTIESFAIYNGSGKLECMGALTPLFKGAIEGAMLAVKLRARGLAAMMGVDTESEKGFIDLMKNDIDISALKMPTDSYINGDSGESEEALF